MNQPCSFVLLRTLNWLCPLTPSISSASPPRPGCNPWGWTQVWPQSRAASGGHSTPWRGHRSPQPGPEASIGRWTRHICATVRALASWFSSLSDRFEDFFSGLEEIHSLEARGFSFCRAVWPFGFYPGGNNFLQVVKVLEWKGDCVLFCLQAFPWFSLCSTIKKR